jgi:hypothetical protein
MQEEMEHAMVILKMTEEFDKVNIIIVLLFSTSDLKTGKRRLPSDNDWAAMWKKFRANF